MPVGLTFNFYILHLTQLLPPVLIKTIMVLFSKSDISSTLTVAMMQHWTIQIIFFYRSAWIADSLGDVFAS